MNFYFFRQFSGCYGIRYDTEDYNYTECTECDEKIYKFFTILENY